MPDEPRLLTSQTGRVLIVRFNNPPRHYFDERMSRELDSLTRQLRGDATVGAVVFTGQDSTYLTHFDVPELLRAANSAPAPVPYGAARVLTASARLAAKSARAARFLDHGPARDLINLGRIYASLRRISRLDKVTITAINGLALGMGCVFALACDIRLIAEDQQIGLPESGLAVLAGASGTQRLVRTVGAGRALEMLLDGRWLSAGEALRSGLVHDIAAPGELLPEAIGMAEKLSERPAAVTREVKRMVYDAGSHSYGRALAMEAASVVRTLSLPEARRRLADYGQWLTLHDSPTDEAIRQGFHQLLHNSLPTELHAQGGAA